MRTTITLDDDVAEKLQAKMRRRRTNNFKETVNDVLRRGLVASSDVEDLGSVTCGFRLKEDHE